MKCHVPCVKTHPGNLTITVLDVAANTNQEPFSVAVFEDEVFWSEMKTRIKTTMKKMTGKNRAVLIKRLEQPYGLKVYS